MKSQLKGRSYPFQKKFFFSSSSSSSLGWIWNFIIIVREMPARQGQQAEQAEQELPTRKL